MFLLLALLLPADRPDIVVADFEGDTYGDWKATGTAFGTGPAKGTLPNQMPVAGFLGKGLVNSYLGGDKATGTLTSPEFKIERRYINFLVGGGGHEKTHIKLFVAGKPVETTRGPNTNAGGTERLEWHTWDVAKYQGLSAHIHITDEETGGWGHINADHFVQSDQKKEAAVLTREIAADARYLHLPVKNGAAKRRVKILERIDVRPFREQVRHVVIREFDIELADGVAPDFWVFADISAFKEKSVFVECKLPADSKALSTLKTSADIPDAEKVYREKHRPLFHFTSRVGWLNDPNGLVFHNGEWHLFYQHNPFGREWGNMHWGHAVSTDLVRWKELGIGLYPRKYGDWAFSGSAVVDRQNTSGWGTKEKPPLVLAYTSTGRGECIAFSTDDGRTWTEYDKNPVVKHVGRDPKLIWHEKAKLWVMAVYTEADKKQWIAFHTSPDLKAWTYASRIEGFFECPDLFPLVPSLSTQEKWVLYGADGKYLVGDFDGKEFKPAFPEKKQLWYGRFYAAQTFDNAPMRMASARSPGGQRRVQIGWAQGVTFPGTPFNQQMNVPVELALTRELALVARPVAELRSLRQEATLVTGFQFPKAGVESKDGIPVVVEMVAPNAGKTALDAFDMEVEIDLASSAEEFGFVLRGTKLTYDKTKGVLRCKDVSAPVPSDGKTLRLRVLVDRGSVEVFADDGKVALSVAAIPDETAHGIVVTGRGGDVRGSRLQVWRMKSGWEK